MVQGAFRPTIRDTCVRHRRHRPTFLSPLSRRLSISSPVVRSAIQQLQGALSVAAAHKAVPTLRRLSIFLPP